MKKILIVSTVSRQFYLFEQGNIEVLKSLGYEVHVAANFEDANERLDTLDIKRHSFDIQRSPFSLKNIKAFRQLKHIMKSEDFDAVHCHSPMGGVLARLAAKSVGIKKVIYTAHGFHFYKGAPFVYWAIYYPIEIWLSKYTGILITINKEDFERAKRFSCRAEHVPGVGIDTERILNNNIDKQKKRCEIGVSEKDTLILSVGELNKNKNHETIIKAIPKINHENIVYIICGVGIMEERLMATAEKCGIASKVKLLGYRNDMHEIYAIADIFVLPSYREGLSVSLMEAMAAGLPVVCSNIRGNLDLVNNGKGGYLVEPDDINDFAWSINKILLDGNLAESFGVFNAKKIMEYDKENIKLIMEKIYRKVTENGFK